MSTPAALKWRPIVDRARASGLSMRAYAQQNGVNANTLAWWNSRLPKHASQGTAFLELVTVAPPPLTLHVGDVRVVVDQRTDLALLRRVVEALG